MDRWHRSVLLNETLELLGELKGGVFADLTFGEGGHTEAILERGAKQVLAVDRDSEAIQRYLKDGALRNDPRLKIFHGNLSSFPDMGSEMGLVEPLNGILMDLGVSTRQLLEGNRGFSFAESGPLDMRMNRSEGPTLEELLAQIEAPQLADIIYENTDLRTSRKVARQILFAYEKGNLKTTEDLAKLFAFAKPRPNDKNPATVIFLALRMWVNQEGREVRETIPRLIPMLKPGGRLAVITFHSSEDRWVKNIFQSLAGQCVCFKNPCECKREQQVKFVTRKAIGPSDDEKRDNARSRSALLRCVERL